jgi:F1F0 ATPase subunit 2
MKNRRKKMNEALSLLAGLLLGAIFFGGLWWTVQRGVSAKTPAVWFLGSLLVRTMVVLGGFYLVSRGDWRRLIACFIGFFVARVVVTLSTSPAIERKRQPVLGGQRT